MMHKSKIILLTLAFGLIFLIFACDDQSQVKIKSEPSVVSGKISQSAIQNKPEKDVKKDKLSQKDNPIPKIEPKVESEIKSNLKASGQELDRQKGKHYDSQGKIDPFGPLIQETPEESKPVVDAGPKRILTPLEKIELSQIRLVAVIIMKNKQIAMVEEASGKGYEVGIGTYIGKNQGRVSQIKDSSIVIKELVKDHKGRLKEHVQEIKLHKIDNEE
ncbi:MAG: pilus assembly protein PilP [Desulfobacula sp.]|nr:pilus assembly protein PilP [Desulfobacula sp.]